MYLRTSRVVREGAHGAKETMESMSPRKGIALIVISAWKQMNGLVLFQPRASFPPAKRYMQGVSRRKETLDVQ